MAVDPARAKTLFLEASDLGSPEERAAYLDRECGGDAELRARVEVLLAAHDGDGAIREPDTTGGSDPELAATRQMTGVSVRPDGPVGTITETATAVSRVGFTPDGVIAGRYRLLELLGEGGMGAVYRAEQSQPVKRQVALKLIRTGMDSRAVQARFDAERQALAMMDHPSIARVYDGGVTEANQPFFAMELVRGVPITDYCDQHRLTVRARLELFVAACQAVQHAHQKGIIHRDIKPSNVMVTEVDGRPTPKVIDFGVAKATEFRLTDQSLSDTGAIVGTPAYMSPEQADPSTRDIDTRTDIYALGVILYELLAGAPPLDASQLKRGALLEMLRMVREVDPPKPSTKVSTSEALPNIAANRGIDPVQLRRALRGDLDWIVMKALEKDRTRRYETANGLGADLLRHLASEPVLAAPPSRSYRLRKFVRKHRVGATAASLVSLVLLAGVTGTTWGLFAARRSAAAERLAKLDAQEKKTLSEENERKALAAAEEEKKAKETVEAVLGFVENKVFAAARPKDQPGGMGHDVKLADAVQAALPSIEKGFPDKPLIEARLRMTIGGSFLGLGKPEIAVNQFEAARDLNRRELGRDHPDTLRSMSGLASSYLVLGRHTEALKLFEETLALSKTKLGPDHPDTLTIMNNLAQSYLALGRNAEALKLFEETLALMKAKLGADHPLALNSMNSLAFNYLALGRGAEALKLFEETLALSKTKLGPDDPQTLRGMNNLAQCYAALNRRADAVKLHEETLALRQAKLGADHPDTLDSMYNLACTYADLDRRADAVKLHEETLALRKARFGADHPDTLASMNNLAQSYAALGRRADAVKLHKETLALCKAKLGPDHPNTLDSMHNLAANYAALGRNAEAVKLHEETLALMKGKFGPDHPDTLTNMNNLGASYLALGRPAEALKLFEEMLALSKTTLGPDHPQTLSTMYNLAASYHALGRRADAVKLNEETLALMKAKLGPDHPGTLEAMNSLAAKYHVLDRSVDAVKLCEEALPLMKAKLGPDHPETRESMRILAANYRALGRRADAVKLNEETLALMKARLGPDHTDTLESMRFLATDYLALGRSADAAKLNEEARARMKAKLGVDHPDTLESMNNLAQSYLAGGRTREALPLLERCSAANPKNTLLSLAVAALQAWFGQDQELAVTRQRILTFARGTDNAITARRAVRACGICPSRNKAELDALLALGGTAVKVDAAMDWNLQALGIAEYRSGNAAAAAKTLLAAAEAKKSVLQAHQVGISAFYRAMCLFELGKREEARALASTAAAKMKPLPADEQNPLADIGSADDLFLWLAYKEAKAMIHFEAAPTAEAARRRKMTARGGAKMIMSGSVSTIPTTLSARRSDRRIGGVIRRLDEFLAPDYQI